MSQQERMSKDTGSNVSHCAIAHCAVAPVSLTISPESEEPYQPGRKHMLILNLHEGIDVMIKFEGSEG